MLAARLIITAHSSFCKLVLLHKTMKTVVYKFVVETKLCSYLCVYIRYLFIYGVIYLLQNQ